MIMCCSLPVFINASRLVSSLCSAAALLRGPVPPPCSAKHRPCISSHFCSLLCHRYSLPRDSSPLLLSSLPCRCASILRFAISFRLFTSPSLCESNLSHSVPQPNSALQCHRCAPLRFAPAVRCPAVHRTSTSVHCLSFAMLRISSLRLAMQCLCTSSLRVASHCYALALPCHAVAGPCSALPLPFYTLTDNAVPSLCRADLRLSFAAPILAWQRPSCAR